MESKENQEFGLPDGIFANMSSSSKNSEPKNRPADENKVTAEERKKEKRRETRSVVQNDIPAPAKAESKKNKKKQLFSIKKKSKEKKNTDSENIKINENKKKKIFAGIKSGNRVPGNIKKKKSEKKEKKERDWTDVPHWLLSIILYSIPIVNIIYLIVAEAMDDERKNWAIASLIVIAIKVVLIVAIIGFILSRSEADLYNFFYSLAGN